MKKTRITIFPAALSLLLLLTLGGCGRRDAAADPAAPTVTNEVANPAAPVETPEAGRISERQDGERFEELILIEGMEETIRCEHVRNEGLGFEVDYDYERFERRSEAARECFVSLWDDPGEPENYLEVTYRTQDADTVAAEISEALAREYALSRDDAFPLERAGRCIRIDASADIGGLTMPEHLQMVYIIPAGEGCRVAAAHYFIEGAEGFGRRFHAMMDSFAPLPVQREKRLSEEEALAAVKRFCLLTNPDLAQIDNAEEAPVYWDLSSAEEDEIVVVFRSYTGALTRYYIDPVSGDARVTEFVPGITPEEVQTDERLNLWDYLD